MIDDYRATKNVYSRGTGWEIELVPCSVAFIRSHIIMEPTVHWKMISHESGPTAHSLGYAHSQASCAKVGSVTSRREKQFLKASVPIELTDFGMCTRTRPVPEKPTLNSQEIDLSVSLKIKTSIWKKKKKHFSNILSTMRHLGDHRMSRSIRIVQTTTSVSLEKPTHRCCSTSSAGSCFASRRSLKTQNSLTFEQGRNF